MIPLIAVAGLALGGLQEATDPGAPNTLELPDGVVQTLLFLDRPDTLVAVRDMDADGRTDLVIVSSDGLAVRWMRSNGTYPDDDDASLAWPGEDLAWDLVDADGDGAVDVAMIVDGKELRVWTPRPGADGAPGGFGDGRTLHEVNGYFPRGRFRMSFMRDVDADGTRDLVVPGSGRYDIHLRRGDGWADPLTVEMQARIGYSVGNPDSLSSNFGQRVRVPWFRLEDVDGDGRQDLRADTEKKIYFHLASPELSAEPTWILDLEALEEDLPTIDGVNFDDLLSHAAHVAWSIEELDGQQPRDLFVQVGSTFRLWHGGARTGPEGNPDQVLKSSGTVLYFFLRDVQGDELPDLQLVRGEKVSLSRVLRWLILPGSLDFDLFTFRNDGGSFSRRPTRRNRVSLKIPRLLSFVDEVEELEERIEAEQEIPAVLADLDGDGEDGDVIDLLGGKLTVFRGRAPESSGTVFEMTEEPEDVDALLEAFILKDLDEMEEGGTKTLDLGEMTSWNFAAGAALREACAGARPDLEVPVMVEAEAPGIHVRDLDGDGRDDVILLGKNEDGLAQLQFVVLR